MRSRFLLAGMCLAASANAQVGAMDEAKRRCLEPDSAEKIVKQEDFRWNMSRAELKSRAEAVYRSGKRLHQRAYYDPQTRRFLLPVRTGSVVVPEMFIRNVIAHVEEALRLNYIDAVVFPDLGHSHFFVPTAIFKREIAPVDSEIVTYERLFSLPELKIVYHTGEQLKYKDEADQLLPDDLLRWRYYVRNLVGFNDGQNTIEIHLNQTAKFNTVKDLEGYEYYGAGFNISSSEAGCFAYRHGGRRMYFDLSLHDLPTDNLFGSQRARPNRH